MTFEYEKDNKNELFIRETEPKTISQSSKKNVDLQITIRLFFQGTASAATTFIVWFWLASQNLVYFIGY